jgi:prepilin-type N-terminal cleavage/methylation domain-containing protein
MCTEFTTMVDNKRIRSIDMCLTDQGGFTLVETLIALVLSSIIFVSSYQVISNLIQYQVRARIQNSSDMDKLLLTNMLSQIIEKSIHQYDLYYQIHKKFLFQGKRDSVQLVSRAYSERYDKPGYRVYRLYHREGELYISYRAYDKDYLSNPQFQLATGLKIEEINFEYFEDNGWVDEWHDERSIPQFIRVKIDFPGTQSTDWIRRTSQG